ncbi:Vascular endothelial growth factor receptor 1 [Eumeta japonica]|uniref:Vascular endothelial growth factor receptor 1 n=1 Tax=Eumeta variegata TaxID=151549 RepID=A0A4C1ZJE2_EUMVA|nr:Vascular endothelial growth factor receptor 1 [Eumeta japonica]
MTYASPVFAHAQPDILYDLQIVQNKLCRRAANAPWYVKNSVLHRDLELPTISKYIKDASERFFNIAYSHPNPLLVLAVSYEPPPSHHFCRRPRNVLIDPPDDLIVEVEKLIELMRPCESRKPEITGSPYFFEHKTIVVNCTVKLSRDFSTILQLVTPNGSTEEGSDPRIKIQSNEQNVVKGVLYKSLTIDNARPEDAGTYACKVECGSTKTSAMDVTFLTPDEAFVQLSRSDDSTLIQTNRNTMRLAIRFKAYPEVNVTVTFCVSKFIRDKLWWHPGGTGRPQLPTPSNPLLSTEEVRSIYQIKSFTEIKAVTSGEITCIAYRPFNVVTHGGRFLVYEIENGFGIKDKMNHCFSQNENITLTCLASKFQFKNVTWSGDNLKNDTFHQVVSSENQHSLISEMKILRASVEDTGTYSCLAFKTYGDTERDSISVTIGDNSPQGTSNTC